MAEVPGEVAARIHDRLQQARRAADGVEDPDTRRAIEALADATDELLTALRGR